MGADGAQYRSPVPGLLGGHRRRHGYGRLDCPAALRWIARGHYVRHRVFFPDEATAVAAGYRPCAACLPDRYSLWKSGDWPPPGCAHRLGDLPGLLDYLRARAVPGVESLSLDDGMYRRALSLPHGPGLVEIDTGTGVLRLLACDSRDHAVAVERCRRLAGLDVDWAEARAALASDELLGPFSALRPRLRVPGAVDGPELAVRAIVNQQVSLAAARTVLGRLVVEHGRAVQHWSLRPFPAPERLAALDPATLPMPRGRARALVAVCEAIAAGRLDLSAGADLAEARAALLAVPGIGDWTASYIAVRALRDTDAFLPTDLGIRRALESLGRPSDRRSIEALGERWRPWRAYAAQVLWAHAAAPSASRATSSAQPHDSVNPLPPCP